ncbi:MAG TPA: hypothetical protein VFS19_01225 [Planctomycetota bacterium]|nr:hypothetical protein [Planctomycetota bacterium]
MQRMLALLLAFLAHQETHELKWALKEGQTFTCSWVADTKVTSPELPDPLMDFRFEIKGTLKVGKPGADGARCELVLSKYKLKGSMGRDPIDIHYESGEVRSPDPASSGGKNILRECTKPVAIRLRSNGTYAVEGKHIAQGIFEGQSDFFGSQLPPAPVAVGASWDGILESPQARAAGRPPMKVKYKLDSRKDDAARIVLDERQEMRAAGRLLDFHAVTESTFNVRAGHCVRGKATIHVNDVTNPKRPKPEKPDIVMTLDLEIAEKK